MAKRILYVDMDNTIVDFQTALNRVEPASLLEEYRGNEDEIPGVFALMDPMPGAVEAVTALARLYDTYVLSTAPWKNPGAWHDKVVWIQTHFGAGEDSPLHKRLILTHHKDLNVGDFLVDDRPRKNGADHFSGEVIHFGSDAFPGWAEVLSYLEGRTDIERVRELAHTRHVVECRQVDKLGRDYFDAHLTPIAEAARVFGPDAEAAGWLHDIVEDTETTERELLELGVPEHIVAAVSSVTKRSDETYEDLITRACADPLGRYVKLADNAWNITSNPDLASSDPDKAARMLNDKYAPARARLLEACGLTADSEPVVAMQAVLDQHRHRLAASSDVTEAPSARARVHARHR
jgi:hypothetical protein